jgi:hypothetical protein
MRTRHRCIFRGVKLVGIEFNFAAVILARAGDVIRHRLGVWLIHILPSHSKFIQTPIAPIVHPKMNTGKEFPSAII